MEGPLDASLPCPWLNLDGALSSTKAGEVGRANLHDGARTSDSDWSVSPDPRLPSSRAVAAQRSINLAISSRGLAAIHAVDPDIVGRFLTSALPMRGRMIHLLGGGQHSQLYDIIHGQVRQYLSAPTARPF